jgi:hypothetical protein
MGYFVRRYIPGVKNSGTKDILRSEQPISTADFVSFAHETGHGKYVLGVRGKGIRGWKKLTDCIVEEPMQVFEAESISVRKNMKVDELSESELMDLLYSMTRTTPKPEDMETFQKDLGKIHSELSKRGSSAKKTLARFIQNCPSEARLLRQKQSPLPKATHLLHLLVLLSAVSLLPLWD